MNLEEARQTFINTWGTLGVEWGINRTMAQIHALLLSSASPLDTEEIMERLQVSRGNANTNLRALVDWGLVTREVRPGVRREFFSAEKDVWEISRAIAVQRRRRELDPMMKVLEALQDVTPGPDDRADAEELQRVVRDIHGLGRKASRLLDLVLRLDQSAFFRPLLAFLGRSTKGDRDERQDPGL